ncbi:MULTISPECIES: hypothetical protein [unclassified Caballeronia]|nr:MULTISPECIES: hypothetical protein [unclassified Caballeronia]MDR5776249.1 hypothetical protein [Caballeronia sp. LZ002]MDR5801168.1 hypothetical protein [Caballeronia sp. LZ001]MDR5851689.1 hypothetical protein [Caballeronia sp. LZ003]
MSLLKIWGVVLIVAAVFLVIDSETSHRKAEMERCAHTRCI